MDHIKQIPGMTGVVSTIYDTPVGEVWTEDKIFDLKRKIESSGLEIEVIERQ